MSPKDLADSLDEQNEAKQQADDKQASLDAVTQSSDKVASAVSKGSQETVSALSNVKGEVKVTNPDLAKSTDVNQAVDAINKLNLTTFMQNEGLPQLAKNLTDLSGKTQDLQDRLENEGLKKMSDQLGAVVKKLEDVSKKIGVAQITVDSRLQKTIDSLSKSINNIDFKPSVNVSAPDTRVISTPVDLKPLLEALNRVEKAIKDSEKEETEQDISPITNGLTAVQDAITSLRFPVPNYVLPFTTKTGKATQVVLNDDGTLPLSSSGGSGTQYADGAVRGTATGTIAMVDDGTNIQSLSGDSTGKLNINSISGAITLPTLAATSTKQSDGTQKTQVVDGSGNVIGATSNALDINIKSGNPTTITATQGTASNLKVAATLDAETTKVIGTARTADGSGNLYTSNSTTYTAKNAQDSNLLGTLGTAFSTAGKVDVKGADGDVFVRNATAANFLANVTLQTQTDTVMVGGVNIKEINAVAPLMGAGNTGTGSLRVTVATDDTNLSTIAAAVHTEDVASNNADKGIAMMAIRDDTLNSTSGTEGDYELLHTTADGALWVTQAPSTSNGWSTVMMTSGDGSTALTNSAQAIKASAGTLGGWYIYNPNATATYVIIYNTAFGSVTVGTTNPQMVLCIPATSAANVEFGNGINFTTAMSAAATTTGGGNSAPSTALEANFYFK